MTTISQFEAAILQLPRDQFARLRDWLLELDDRRWDEELKRDVAAGKLDALADEAIAEFKGAGPCTP